MLLSNEERDAVYTEMGYGDTKSLREVWEEYGTDHIAKRIAKAQLKKVMDELRKCGIKYENGAMVLDKELMKDKLVLFLQSLLREIE